MFVKGSYSNRFCYYSFSRDNIIKGDIGLPTSISYDEDTQYSSSNYKTAFHWIISSINHEELHKILDILEGDGVCKALDNIPYRNLECGYIKYNKKW